MFYARVSTTDQTLDHQVVQATNAGFTIDEVISDHGVSGVSTRLSDREQGKRLFDILRKDDVLVVRWVDRLGRNYQDVTDTIRTLMRQGVVIKTVINKLTFDGSTTDPMEQAIRDAMIGFMAASAQAQAEVQKEAQQAGIKSAKSDKTKYRGKKPSYTRDDLNTVINLVNIGTSTTEISRHLGLTRQTVLRIRSDPQHANSIMTKWGL